MIKSVRSARLRYEQFQLETLRKKKSTEKQLERNKYKRTQTGQAKENLPSRKCQ